MFIVSKRNYMVRRADGSPYLIKKDYIGHVPEDVAESGLVQRAIKSGRICVPQGSRDGQLEEADREAEERAAGSDIRPDASGAEAPKEAGEDPAQPAPAVKRGSKKQG